MKIKIGRPWFTFLIRRYIGEPHESAVFTVGSTIFLPRQSVPADVIRHEMVHVRQQRGPFGATRWWVRYLRDPEFRIRQEAEAYSIQFNETVVKDRNQRARWLAMLASTLAGPLYGNATTQSAAKALIENG